MGQMAVDRSRVARAAMATCLLALLVSGSAALAATSTATAPGDYSVTLEQCVSSGVQAERSATFVSQMVATAATQKMAMRIVLEGRTRSEAEYHPVPGPGFGVWRPSEPGVKIYKYVKQVTNLAAPAVYRTTVKFRWVGDKGKVIKRAELRSSRCFQPTLAPPVTPPPAAG
jgi:hypothetical protein